MESPMQHQRDRGEKIPFYFLKCEIDDDFGGRSGTQKRDPSKATCTVRVFGKNEAGETVVVELFNYQPDFFISFLNRDICRRNLKLIQERLRQYAEHLSNTDGDTSEKSLDAKPQTQFSHIKGIEVAEDYDSLIMSDDHHTTQRVGDTSLRFTYRVCVRSFGHIRPAIGEILRIARETAAKEGEYTGPACLKRHVHFYESSLDANVRTAERLKLRPCRWGWLDTSGCKTTVAMSSSRKAIHRFTYDFLEHIDDRFLKTEGRIEYNKLPFAEATDDLSDKLPPTVSVMSFDIECLANDVNVFPTPDVCSVIQIATVTVSDALNRPQHNTRTERRLYTVDRCEELDETTTLKCFDSEREMLEAFCSDFVDQDPDIVTGYYIENFDLPFIFARLSHHQIPPVLGRLGLRSSCVANTEKGGGGRKYASYTPKSNFTKIHGRTVFDTCVFVRKEFSLRSYTLNAVSEHFLKSRKEDVHYTQIPSLFAAGPRSRAILGRYCVKDAQLVMDIVFHIQAFVTTFERCKVFNTTLEYLLDRGQQVRITSMLLKWCSQRRTLIDDCTTPNEVFYNNVKSDMKELLYECDALHVSNAKRCVKRRGGEIPAEPDCTDENEDDEEDGASSEKEEGEDRGGKTKNTKYDGAVVIEPKRGLYHDPIVCLDYASLYPSIMIAYNLCYSTMVLNRKKGEILFNRGAAFRSPVGHYFLTHKQKRGVLPDILETLLRTRAEVRKRMVGLSHDSIEYMLLNGQQGALKVAANSIYGATGCQKGKLYFLQIPSSVTAYGRAMIVATKEFIEKEYPDRQVVYGDTDSVMVHLVGWTAEHKKQLWDCTDAGNQMAHAVTRLIDRPPIRLQFETVYLPFLLANKKRYAAGVYKSLESVQTVAAERGVEAAQKALETAEKHITCKGLEVVRRDNCLFAKNTLQKTIDMIMAMVPPDRVLDELRQEIVRLLNGDMSFRDLIISKEWSKRTKNPTPHDRLAQKLAERNPGKAPRLGDRIQYIVIESPDGESRKMFDRAEDPLYVLENGLAIDYVYYADNQLLNPLVNVLSIVMPDSTKEEIKDTLWPSANDSRFPVRPSKKLTHKGQTKRPRKNTKHDVAPPNNRRITSFFGRSTETQLANANEIEKDIRDIEDICTRLAKGCLECKKRDAVATASCRDLDCPSLFERYKQKRRVKTVGCDVRGKVYAEVLGFEW
ncbi:DNA polymerase delta catalytic subunit-like [Macrosteles quadrilineatus]|uniref:DNA polymerase delta catalytic subunit-like n=1 Tax=Macrosteles quadrilineatus TaxID=74068 RepID=UPI0023E10FCC|nr:DNA polymerase delta catalytic subunit-like [Macrosteles quadrilineatus]